MGAAPKVDKSNPLLDKTLINAFIEGVIKTMSLMAQTKVTVEKPSIETVYKPKGDVAGVVGMVAGNMRGTLAITYEKTAILKIIRNMLGEDHTEINESVADGVGELANQMYGAAKAVLNKMGYAFEMAVPSIIRGSFMISKQHVGATLVIPFSLEGGSKFYVAITVSS